MNPTFTPPATPICQQDRMSDETIIEIEHSEADLSAHDILQRLEEQCKEYAASCEARAKTLASRARISKIATVSSGALTTLLSGLAVAGAIADVAGFMLAAITTLCAAADRGAQWEVAAKKAADAARGYAALQRRAALLRASSNITSERLSKISQKMRELDIARMLL